MTIRPEDSMGSQTIHQAMCPTTGIRTLPIIQLAMCTIFRTSEAGRRSMHPEGSDRHMCSGNQDLRLRQCWQQEGTLKIQEVTGFNKHNHTRCRVVPYNSSLNTPRNPSDSSNSKLTRHRWRLTYPNRPNHILPMTLSPNTNRGNLQPLKGCQPNLAFHNTTTLAKRPAHRDLHPCLNTTLRQTSHSKCNIHQRRWNVLSRLNRINLLWPNTIDLKWPLLHLK